MEHFSLFKCINIPQSVPKLAWMSTSNNLPVFTTEIKLSAFADDFVKQSSNHFWLGIWPNSCILPEHACFRYMEIIWIVSFGKKKVNCSCCRHRILRVSANVNISNFTWKIHHPRKNWHAPKHLMNKFKICHDCWEYGLVHLLTFVVNKTSVRHSILWWSLMWFFQQHCHASLRKTIPRCFD